MVAAFKEKIREVNPKLVTFDTLETLQLNLGDLCNLACSHCHVGASPAGNRIMGRQVMEEIIAFLTGNPSVTLDITGGCPEMNPHFRFLIEATDGVVAKRIIRSNLVILTESDREWLPKFFSDHNLTVVASLPCYLEENVDRQRGEGVYLRSIAALKILNSLGYGSTRELNLVYNPGGAFLPGVQQELETAYRTELQERHGIRFNSLYTITNAPLGRFRQSLEKNGALDRYMETLVEKFNPCAAHNIMCRSLISIDFQGHLYNCDFNQEVGLPLKGLNGQTLFTHDLYEATRTGAEIRLDQHCYCCTAGEGSSCTGALVA